MLFFEMQTILYILEQITQWTVNLKEQTSGDIIIFTFKNGRITVTNDIRK